MTKAIAVIGWGSLIWDLDDLAPKVRGPWRRGAGPTLPIEFSRISPKRRNALAAVLDPAHGAPCATSVIESAADSLDAAVDDLAARERADRGFIGAVLADGRGHDGPIADRIAAWCAEAGWRGAVWTALKPNFEDRAGAGFSVDAAAAYLFTLEGASFGEAVRYISRAPHETDTPLRRALDGLDWWRAARDALT